MIAEMPQLLIALFMAMSVCASALGALIAVVIFWIADQRGQRRPGSHGVRSQRNRASSRGHKPYRGGRVRV